MELELEPSQPPEVLRVVSELLAARTAQPDPWWQTGIDESLEPLCADP
jgi:hypothetical protein